MMMMIMMIMTIIIVLMMINCFVFLLINVQCTRVIIQFLTGRLMWIKMLMPNTRLTRTDGSLVFIKILPTCMKVPSSKHLNCIHDYALR